MQSKDQTIEDDGSETITYHAKTYEPEPSQVSVSSLVQVQADEPPTIPLGSLQALNALRPDVSVHAVATSRGLQRPAPLVVQPAEYRPGLVGWAQIWWDGMRPRYALLALFPVLLGTTFAWLQTVTTQSRYGHIHLLHFIAILAAVLLLQIGANLVNDYYDYMKGIDTSNALGPGGLIQQGYIRPKTILTFGLGLCLLGALAGLLVATSGGFYLFLLGLVGILSAYLYSATAFPLSSLALGEVVGFLIFGPLLALAAYMAQLGIPTRHELVTILQYSLPLGLLAVAIIHVNNMRDAESDLQAGKHTVANLLGPRLSRFFFLLLILAAYAVVLVLGLPRHAPHLILLPLWTLPILLVVITGIARADLPVTLNIVLRKTITLETFFALLLIIAIILPALLGALPHIPHLPF